MTTVLSPALPKRIDPSSFSRKSCMPTIPSFFVSANTNVVFCDYAGILWGNLNSKILGSSFSLRLETFSSSFDPFLNIVFLTF